MVVNHVYFGSLFNLYISSFHMPLFFITTGYLWQFNNETFAGRIKRKAKKLILPYISFGAFFVILDILIQNNVGNKVFIVDFERLLVHPTLVIPRASTLWFLPCMFFADLIYTFIQIKVYFAKTVSLICIFLSILGVLCTIFREVFILPWSLGPALIATLLIHIGYILRNNLKVKNRIKRILIGKNYVLIVIGNIVFTYVNGIIDMRQEIYGNIILFFLNSMVSTILLWKISLYIIKLKFIAIKKIKSAIIYISMNSMAYICTNRVLIDFNSTIFRSDTVFQTVVSKIINFILTMFICCAINELLCNSKLKILIGK